MTIAQDARDLPGANVARMIEVGTASAVIAFTMAVLRMATTSILGRYPEPFAGVVGGVWWSVFGLSIGLALGAYLIATAKMIRGE